MSILIMIPDVNPEDMSSYWYLEVFNEVGSFQYNFELRVAPPPTTMTPWEKQEGGDGGGVNVGMIVGKRTSTPKKRGEGSGAPL